MVSPNDKHYEVKEKVQDYLDAGVRLVWVVDPENRVAMLADGAVAWLDVPLERVIERVPADGRRPLASDRTQMEQLYASRGAAYAQAHVRIDAARPIPEIVERILEWIGF